MESGLLEPSPVLLSGLCQTKWQSRLPQMNLYCLKTWV